MMVLMHKHRQDAYAHNINKSKKEKERKFFKSSISNEKFVAASFLEPREYSLNKAVLKT